MDAVDRRAAALLGALAALVGLADGLAEALGLRWLQEVEWPTDLYAFGQLAPEPLDVAVVGSSRAHFGLPPSGLDVCLSARLGRPTRTVGLNRLTASAFTEDVLARDLLADTPPAVLLVEVAPETVNARHFEMDYNLSSGAAIRDVPDCLLDDPGLDRAAACARPLVRGVENLAQLLQRPLDDTAHLRWMMTQHGGGQYCYADAACRARNAAYDTSRAGRWEKRLETVIGSVRSTRFRDYTIDGGLNGERLRALARREEARGVEVVLVNLPVHEVYQREVPAEVYQSFLTWAEALATAEGATWVDLNTPARQHDRAAFLDPDHLDADGAEALTRGLCEGAVGDLLAARPAQNWK